MKKLKKIAVIVVLSLFASQSYAQMSFGGSVGYFKMFGDYSEISNLAVNLQGHYAVSDKILVTLSAGYCLPKSFPAYDEDLIVTATGLPDGTTVEMTEKVSFIPISVEGKYFFVGEVEGDFNMYGLVGAGYLLGIDKISAGDYNKNIYDEPFTEGASLGNFTLNAGLGAEFNLGFGYLFVDGKILLPANLTTGSNSTVDTSTDVTPKLPASIMVNAGVRIPLGN